MGVHDAVVVHHRQHESARERVAIDQRHGGHGVGQNPVP